MLRNVKRGWNVIFYAAPCSSSSRKICCDRGILVVVVLPELVVLWKGAMVSRASLSSVVCFFLTPTLQAETLRVLRF